MSVGPEKEFTEQSSPAHCDIGRACTEYKKQGKNDFLRFMRFFVRFLIFSDGVWLCAIDNPENPIKSLNPSNEKSENLKKRSRRLLKCGVGTVPPYIICVLFLN